MFYIIIIPALLITLYMMFFLKSLDRHDKVLYRICQVRRDTMAFIRDNFDNISKEDYLAIKQQLDVLNSVVNNYNDHKTVLFNFRKYLQYMKDYKSLNNKADEIEIMLTENPKIKELHTSLRKAFLYGFFYYTPLIRSEIVAMGLLFLTSILAKIGHSYISNAATKINDILSLAREQEIQLKNCC